MPIELSMTWPVLLNDSCPMKLMIYGCVVRSNDKGAAVAIERYEFRTQGRTFQQTQPASNAGAGWDAELIPGKLCDSSGRAPDPGCGLRFWLPPPAVSSVSCSLPDRIALCVVPLLANSLRLRARSRGARQRK